MKKHNDDSPFLKDWTTKKLKYEQESLKELIYKIGSYGTEDIHNDIAIKLELINRGF